MGRGTGTAATGVDPTTRAADASDGPDDGAEPDVPADDDAQGTGRGRHRREDAGPARRRTWLAAAPGLVLLAYVAGWAVDLSQLAFDPARYSTPWRWASSLGGRLVLCVVLVCGLGHGLAGLATIVGDLVPPVARHPGRARAVVQFLLAALALPACLLVLGPWFRGGA